MRWRRRGSAPLSRLDPPPVRRAAHPRPASPYPGARARGLEVLDRCNLTVLAEPGYEDLPDYLAAQGVRIVASLPCYTKTNVDTQRGNKVCAV